MKEYYIFLHKILNYFITVIKSLNRDSIIFLGKKPCCGKSFRFPARGLHRENTAIMKKLRKLFAMLVSFAMVIGTLTVTAMAQEYPVYIGDTGYDTIQDAVAALSSDGQTIRVSEAFTDTGSSQALTGTNYSFTVDLGGKTFTGARAFAPTGVTVTLKNGTITSTNNTAGCAVRATSGAVVTLGEGLLITGCSSSNNYGCVQGSASTITVDGAVLENSLNTSNNARTIYLGSNSTLNIVSGTVEITAYAYQGTINVSGGFVGKNMLTKGSSGSIVVTGGYFGANPSGYYSSA